jgi:hypothetical protein
MTVARSLHPFAYIGPGRVYTSRDRRFLLAKNRNPRSAAISIRLLRELPHSNRRTHGVLMRMYISLLRELPHRNRRTHGVLMRLYKRALR